MSDNTYLLVLSILKDDSLSYSTGISSKRLQKGWLKNLLKATVKGVAMVVSGVVGAVSSVAV
jgi:hypothetical protein